MTGTPSEMQTPVPPTGEARFFVGAALVVTLGFVVWMATLPEVLDMLWLFVPVQLIPFARKEWRGFRRACFVIGGTFVALSVFGALFGWFLLLPAALLLFVAGSIARQPPPPPWQRPEPGPGDE